MAFPSMRPRSPTPPWRCPAWVLWLVAIFLALGGALTPPVRFEPAPSHFELAGARLFDESQVGLDLHEGALVLSAEAPASERYAPHPSFGMGVSVALDLRGPAAIEGLAADADVPAGAGIRVEARGRTDGPWTEWSDGGAPALRQGIVAVQVRVSLFAAPDGASPRVRAVSARARPLKAPGVAHAQVIFGPPTVTLWATRIGLVGQTTANGHVIQERDHFVALPSTRALNAPGRQDYRVRIEYRGRTVEVPVWDTGPWNIRDDYWNQNREDFRDLPRWKSEAEAAFFDGYRGGYDGFGRYVTVPTSIDLADGTFWDDLHLGPNDWVRVTFLWLDAPSPPPRATPLVIPKSLSPPLSLIAVPGVSPTVPGQRTLTITWDTGTASTGQVYVSVDGSPENLFGQGPSGSQTAPVLGGRTYVFRLYEGTAHSALLAEITPARPANVAPTISVAPGRAPPGAAGGAAILWDTGDGSLGQVYASSGGSGESFVAQGSSGLQLAPWIVAGQTYLFRLYRGPDRSALLISATVTGPTPAPTPAATPTGPTPVPAGPSSATFGSHGGLIAAALPGGHTVHVVVGVGAMADLASAVGTGATIEVAIDPAPRPPNEAAAGSLGGGMVVPVGGPIDIKATVRLGSGAAVRILPGDKPDVGLRVSLPVTADAARVHRDGRFGWLQAIYDETGFLGYLRPPAEFDAPSNTVTLRLSASDLAGTLFLPAVLVPAWVANHDEEVHVFSGPTPEAEDFGVAGPQFTTFLVVGPQVADRLHVFNPVTENYGWVDVSGVGPAGPPTD